MPEPIAVVGLGCRFPGDLGSPEQVWDALRDGRSTVGRIPDERWETYAAAGPDSARLLRDATRWGGVLSDIAGFDAQFFGISPREAEVMDPQQRLLLEVAWEALEHAGIPATSLAGTRTGVFVGISAEDYGRRLLEDLPTIDSRTSIGVSVTAAAARISYALDLHGPSFAVDTACSSSLVAVHLACRSLREGESEVALAAGVNALLSPGPIVSFDQAGGLAADGRCKTFDESADGFVRAEGAGVVVLKRLSDARRDGDRVLALVRGSAVNSDGRTDGIMAPSRYAQEEVLRDAYADAGVDPATVDYVETHGTGTVLGDPIETGSVGAVLGAVRPDDRPLLIGSIKTNIGHLEAGAGVAGLAKVVLALRHGELPPNLNLTTLNPAIKLDELRLRVVTERTPWPVSDSPRRAGVSSYGYGGTNAHLVIEEAAPEEAAPEEAPEEVPERAPDEAPADRAASGEPTLLALSGTSPDGLRDAAEQLADWLADGGPGGGADVPLPDLAHTLARRRAHLPYRLTVAGADRAALRDSLRTYLADGSAPAVVTGSVTTGTTHRTGRAERPVFVFSGHGSQWTGMGRELLDREPVFAASIAELAPVFAAEAGFPLAAAVRDWDMTTTGTHRLQPLIFAMQVSLAAVWRSQGVEPAAVIGHSLGELASAVVSGALSPVDGARLVCRRSALWPRVMGRGAMAMVELPAAEVTRRLAGRDGVHLAIHSAPGSSVVGGDIPAIEALVAEWEAEGLFVRRVATDVAFHCPQMQPLVADLMAAVADLPAGPPLLPVYTTALDDPRSTELFDPRFWGANLRNPVRFAQAVTAAVEDGYRTFVEVSPHPVVTSSVEETLAAAGVRDGVVAHTVRRNKPVREILAANLGALHCAGAAVDVGARVATGRLVDLPTRPWRHERYWHESSPRGDGGTGHDPATATLLGSPLSVAGDLPIDVWRTTLGPSLRPTPRDYAVAGTALVPASVQVATLLAAARETHGPGVALTGVELAEALSPDARREVQVVGQDGRLRLSGRAGSADGWALHATAATTPAGIAADTPAGTAAGAPIEPGDPLGPLLEAYGVTGPGFDWRVTGTARDGATVTAAVRFGPAAGPGTGAPEAALLDAALHVALLAAPDEPVLRLPRTIARVAAAPAGPVTDVVVTVRPGTGGTDVVVAAPDGTMLLELTGLVLAALDGPPTPPAPAADLVHTLRWVAVDVAAGEGGGEPGPVVLVGPDLPLARDLVARLPAAVRVDDADGLAAHAAELSAGGAVLVLPAAAAPDLDGATAAGWQLVAVADRLAALGTGTPPRLWCVTDGVREAATAASLTRAPLWGLAPVVAGEHPQLRAVTVDLDPADPAGSADALVALLGGPPAGETLLVPRDGAVLVPRLAPAAPAGPAPSTRLRPGGTYVVTGGLGDLGLATAHRLVERGARALLLTGRRGLPARADRDAVTDPADRRRIAAVRALEAAGATVAVLAADIASEQAAAALRDPASLGLPPVRGVVHAAGVVDDRMLEDLDAASLRAVLAPKVAGGLALDAIFPPGSLDFFVLFSSASAWMGLPGHASYAAANAFLDALARHRRAGGDAATSLGWGAWRGLGLAVAGGEVLDNELRAFGSRPLLAPEAFRAWDLAVRDPAGYAAVLPFDHAAPGLRRVAILRDLAADTDAAATVDWAALEPGDLRERLAGEVGRHVAAEMKIGAGALDPDRALAELGLDSIMSLAIRRRLEDATGRTLPATLLWNHPTVTALTGFLARLLAPAAAPADLPAAGAAIDLGAGPADGGIEALLADIQGSVDVEGPPAGPPA